MGRTELGPSANNAGVLNYYKAVFTEDEAEACLSTQEANGKWPDTVAKRKTYYSKEWRTWQMSDHLPLFIELRIDFTEKYLKRIRMGEQPVNSPDARCRGRLRSFCAKAASSHVQFWRLEPVHERQTAVNDNGGTGDIAGHAV
ncbi:MAG: hypothetical protein IPK20_25890 [Betaproteobacteria bacterium]|nr:hypothetical protein [Betaproteobacteria bacterium]